MKTIIIGTIAFIGWSTLSSYIYVCNIKNLCYEDEPSYDIIAAQAESKNDLRDAEGQPSKVEEASSLVKPVSTFRVLHEYNQANLIITEELKSFTTQLSTYLRENPATISLTGYTDSSGSAAYNMKLGRLRAETVKDFLMKQGIDQELISVKSKGESGSLPGQNEALNRKTLIQIQP